MIKLQDSSGINGSTCDAASNLSYSSGPELSELTAISGLVAATNINEAISVLAQEIAKLKSSVGLVAPLGIPSTLPDKKLRLEALREL